MPRITVVQAKGAAPFARLYAAHGSDAQEESLEFEDEQYPHTLASAIKIGAPVSWKRAWRAVRETGGQVITVDEQEIADAKAIIGRDGVGCEPASATTVAGIRRLVAEGVIRKDDKVVAVLTGHLLKDTDYVIRYHSGTLEIPWRSGAENHGRIVGNFSNPPLRVAGSSEVVHQLVERLLDEEQTGRA
jgi:threonine synthase